MMDSNLSYNSEEDKCYGATGMAISLLVLESDEMLSSISLDAPSHQIIDLVDDFYFAGNPTLSAKSAWTQIMNSYNLQMAMAIGNVLCRTMVRDGKMPDAKIRKKLLKVATREGEACCSLEEDECRHLFEKNYNFLYRVFNHRGVQEVANNFADNLTRMRTMTRLEILDRLRPLHSL